jgi:hypothetical protein
MGLKIEKNIQPLRGCVLFRSISPGCTAGYSQFIPSGYLPAILKMILFFYSTKVM